MANPSEGQPIAPTYYANFVTSNFNVDELVMELRRVDVPHRDSSPPESSAAFTIIPPLAAAEILKHEPIARVVMTFSAAKALKQYLDNTLPLIEESRRSGKAL